MYKEKVKKNKAMKRIRIDIDANQIIAGIILSCMLVAYAALWVYSGHLMESQTVESQTIEATQIRNLMESQTVESQTAEMALMRNLITIK